MLVINNILTILLRLATVSGLLLAPLPILAAPAGGEASPLDVLLLSTYSKNNPSTRELEAGFDDALHFSNGRNNYHTEYLDTPRLPEADSSRQLAAYLQAKFRSDPPDVIVAWAPAACRFLIANPELFPGSKRIYLETAQASPEEAVSVNDNQSWIEVSNDYQSSLTELKRFYNPDTLYVIGETGNKSATDRRNNFRLAFDKVMPGVRLEFLEDMTVSEIVEHLNAGTGKKVAAYYLLQFKDGNEAMTPFRVLERIAAASAIPVFSLWDSLMGSGVVGGALFNHRIVGRAIANALLAGDTKPGKLDIATTSVSYDWQALQHWHLDSSLIPAGAQVINRPDNLLYRYRYYLLAIVLVIAALAMLSLNLARTVKARNAALADLQQERGSLADKVAERTLELGRSIEVLNHKNAELQHHIDEIKTLKGIIPICSFCKKVRNDRGYWDMVESYISKQTDAQFSHGVCPDCLAREYDDIS